jgi:hypothetical protein
MPSLKASPKIRPWLYSFLAIAILATYFGLKQYRKGQHDSIINFQPSYALPAGWVKVPHGPTTLFKFAEPKTKLVLRGSVNQVISDVNPTPDWDTDGIANFYVDRTKESMPAWTAEVLRKYDNPTGTEFEVIRRSTKDRIVVTAYAVKGNTTLLITLFGKNHSMQFVDGNMDKLYSFLDTVALTEKDMSQL